MASAKKKTKDQPPAPHSSTPPIPSEPNAEPNTAVEGHGIPIVQDIPIAQALPMPLEEHSVSGDVELAGERCLSETNHTHNTDAETARFTVSANKPPPGKPYGINIREVNGMLYVSNINTNSTFSNTRLQVGCVIVAINDINCRGMSPREALTLLQEAALSEREQVALTIQRSELPIVTVATPVAALVHDPPPGAPTGGVWMTESHTPLAIKILIVVFLVLGLFLFWPACWFACCTWYAFHKRRVYVVNGVKYSKTGEVLSHGDGEANVQVEDT